MLLPILTLRLLRSLFTDEDMRALSIKLYVQETSQTTEENEHTQMHTAGPDQTPRFLKKRPLNNPPLIYEDKGCHMQY